MEFNASTLRSAVFACAIIGVCQSAIWIVLTVCAILTFRCVLRTPQYDTDHVILTTIVKLYFEGDDCKIHGHPPGCDDFSKVKCTKPVVIYSWMIAFAIASSAQFVASAFLLKRRNGEVVRSVLMSWCFITFLVCAMDAALAGTFVADYIALKEVLMADTKEDEVGIGSAPASMFVIAARGFALWIVNACFLLYFTIFLACNSPNEESCGGRRRGKSVDAIAMDNRGFSTSSENLGLRPHEERRYLSSYDASREMAFSPVTQLQRRYSVSSFEAVTRFNEAEDETEETAKKRYPIRESSRFECDCEKWADKSEGGLAARWRSSRYHSHGCRSLRFELENKLGIIEGFDERVPNKAKKLPDFSHDLRNFKPGNGASTKAKESPHQVGIPKAPQIPAAAACDNSAFY